MCDLPAEIGIDAARRALTAAFREAGIETPALDARLLVMAACDITHTELICDPDRPLHDGERARLSTWTQRRLAGAPVSRILGSRAFWGLDFRLGPETLDPRPDTETLVEAVLEALPARDAPLRVLDLGTGTGCILVALLTELPQAQGVGTDISHAALITARENASRAGVADRACFVQADWLSGIGGRFDVIVSNPPYIAREALGGLSREVRAHDPLAALDGGADGLAAYRAILGDVGGVTAPGGIVALEVGAGQAKALDAMMRAADLTPAQPDQPAVRRDLASIERALVMKRREAHELPKKELESRAIRASLQQIARALPCA